MRPKGNKFEVIAGGRRHAAALELLDEGKIAADFPMPCQIKDTATEGEAEEISLAENVVREKLHPADEFEAFQALATEGLSVTDIAARFGVTDTVVKKRMKLANVSPKVMEAYRAGSLDLDQVQAFSVSNDHRRQERLLKEGTHFNAPYIRRNLNEGKIPATDGRVKFVTLDAYVKAGGTVSSDLFNDGPDSLYIEKPDLLTELYAAALAEKTAALKAEGWNFVQASADKLDHAALSKYEVAPPVVKALTSTPKGEDTMRCKFKLNSITRSTGTKRVKDESGEEKWIPAENHTLKFSPVYANGDRNHENTRFWQASPSGAFEVSCVNPDAVAGLQLDGEYYIDITPAPATT